VRSWKQADLASGVPAGAQRSSPCWAPCERKPKCYELKRKLKDGHLSRV